MGISKTLVKTSLSKIRNFSTLITDESGKHHQSCSKIITADIEDGVSHKNVSYYPSALCTQRLKKYVLRRTAKHTKNLSDKYNCYT